jgi:hypothetical protein
MVQPLRSDRQKAAIGRDSHDRLRDAERDDLRVCGATRGVVLPLRQEIVSRDENGREQQVEVGVHRGLQGRRCELARRGRADGCTSGWAPRRTALAPPRLCVCVGQHVEMAGNYC